MQTNARVEPVMLPSKGMGQVIENHFGGTTTMRDNGL